MKESETGFCSFLRAPKTELAPPIKSPYRHFSNMRIDAHQHFWNLKQFPHPWITESLQPLRHNFLPADLRPLLDQHRLDGSVLVQTFGSLEETRWFLSLATQHEFILGVVGWVDLQDPGVGDTLDALADHPKLVGIRHVVHDEPDPQWLTRPEVLRGLGELARRKLPYDLLLRPPHLPAAIEVARQFPTLPLVVDQIAKPRIASLGWDDWAEPFAALARFPSVYCKLSGMITEASWSGWKPSDLHRYVDHALQHFGPERLMFGSDWPVCLLAGSYARVVEGLEANLSPLKAQDQDRIWGGTAQQFYRLSTGAGQLL